MNALNLLIWRNPQQGTPKSTHATHSFHLDFIWCFFYFFIFRWRNQTETCGKPNHKPSQILPEMIKMFVKVQTIPESDMFGGSVQTVIYSICIRYQIVVDYVAVFLVCQPLFLLFKIICTFLDHMKNHHGSSITIGLSAKSPYLMVEFAPWQPPQTSKARYRQADRPVPRCRNSYRNQYIYYKIHQE